MDKHKTYLIYFQALAVVLAILHSSAEAVTEKKIFIDFGKTSFTTVSSDGDTWNDVADTAGDAYLTLGDFPSLTDLQFSDGTNSGFDFDLVASTAMGDPEGAGTSVGVGIGGVDMPGTLAATGYPESATRDALFVLGPNAGDAVTVSGGVATFKLQNLSTSPGTFYTLRMFSRITGPREDASFTVGGVNKVIEHTNNTSEFVAFPLVQPDGSGTISIDFTTADDPDGNFFDQAHWSVFEVIELSNLTPGDVDFDDDVDTDDLRVILDNFTMASPTINDGDLTADGNVDFQDYLAWRTEFLNSGGSLSAIPEPSTGLLAAVGLAVCLRRRRFLRACAGLQQRETHNT